MQTSSRIPFYKLTNQNSKCNPYPNGWKWCIPQITGFRRPWLKRLARYTARSMMQARAYFVGVPRCDLDRQAVGLDVERSVAETLPRGLLAEILHRDLC